MKDLKTSVNVGIDLNKINPLWYLAMGIITMALTHMSFSVEIMYAHLPAKGVTTLYSIIHDAFVYLCISFVLIFSVISIRSWNKKQ